MTPAMAKDRITAGPALPAPPPIRGRMPVPTIAPPPSATRCGHDSDCLSRCSAGMSSRATTVLRTFQFFIRHPLGRANLARHRHYATSLVVLRYSHRGVRAANGRDSRQDREPARDLIFGAGGGIALPVGDHFDEQFAGDVLARGDRGLLPGGNIRRNDPQPVEPDRPPQRVDRVEACLLYTSDAADE